jgi:phosphatidylinositol alpha-1,6-mannosyltransferase
LAQPQPGLGRRRIAAWYAAFAGYAVLVAVFSRHADQSWGIWAIGGYLLAAITAVLCRGSRGRDAALFIGAAGALAGPLTWLATRWPATADVQVVARAAMLLLHQGSPYLGPAHLSAWRSYDPYLPAMTVFGLFRAVGLPGLVGDPRLWLAVACVSLLAVAFGVAAPHSVLRCAGCRHEALRRAAFTVTTPVLAMPLALGITDPPVLALFCLALACVGVAPAAAGVPARALRWPSVPRRIRPSRSVVAGIAIGIACAMKITAWPALPVIAVMIAERDGIRAAWRFAATTVVTAGAAIVATAPGALAKPAVFVQNIVLYPLGLTRHVTPAASPLPGHLLAATGTAGHWAAICLLCAAGLAVAAWVIVRRPAVARDAAWRLAVGLCVVFVLAPATRWGYFAYPLGLLAWLGLTGRDRALTERSAQSQARSQAQSQARSRAQANAPARGVAGPSPVVARLTSVLAGLLSSQGALEPAVATEPAAGPGPAGTAQPAARSGPAGAPTAAARPGPVSSCR